MAKTTKEREMEGEPKIGVYVCQCGGNISEHVNVEKVCERASKIPGVVVARENMFMCSDPGQDLIIEDLKSGTVDRVVSLYIRTCQYSRTGELGTSWRCSN
jgi:heterodisulfide reductase subunit A